MADKKPTNREKLNEITASIERGIKELFQSDKYATYLRTLSRFHSYSARNTILIHMQRPDATAVAGFNAWKNKFQRHVKKGEKGITILAPTPYKKKIEQKKLDPVTMAPMLDQNGSVIMEEKEIEIPMFRPVKVFDVAQTEGKPLPSLAVTLTGDVQNYEIFMEALRRTSPVPIDFKPLEPHLDGFFSSDSQSITLREGMSEVQTICAAVHEITHSLLHNREKERLSAAAGTEQAEKVKPKDRNTEEVEAESVSYAVCQYYGIETSENSLGYIATWSKDRSLPELKASLDTIGKTANALITSIDRNFRDICKERGIDLTPPEPDQGAPEPEAPAAPVAEISPEAAAEIEEMYPDPMEKLRDHFAQEDDAPIDTILDEYPMPDPNISADSLSVSCNYTDGDLLPLSKDRAMELLERDFTVYMVQFGENPSMVFDAEELLEYSPDTTFAVPREEWEASPDFHQAIVDRLNHQEDRERAFLDHGGDCFAIYQVKDGEGQRDFRFMNMDWLASQGLAVDRANYDLAYTGEIAFGQGFSVLEKLWEKFNLNHPVDYHRPSMSVSDIVALKQDGVVSFHYCDSVGFVQLPDFIKPENYLKNAEMATEDDFGMIDGIINNGPKQPTVAELEQQARSGQPISLMELAAATHREERKKKQSAREKLKNQPKQEPKRTAPRKSAERER